MLKTPNSVVELTKRHADLIASKADTYKAMPKEVEKLTDAELDAVAVFFAGTRSRIKRLDRPARVKFIAGQLCRGDCFRY